MKFAESFERLGYSLESVRQDWSSENEAGVCITLWRKELFHMNRLPYYDLWELHPNGGAWEQKPGHSKRTRQIARAIEQFEGKVDVVLVTGEPGVSYGDAEPWDSNRRGGHWEITKFDPTNGYFRAEIKKSNS